MKSPDVIVVGGGISGLALAFFAARDGKQVLVLESSERIGGCLDSRRHGDYWFELGAHTCYNSYTTLIEILEGTGMMGKLVPRGDARKVFGLLRGGKLTTMGPLSVLFQFNPFELLLSMPVGLFASKAGRSTAEYYGKLLGRNNFAKVLGPFLSAVPSQSADGFPAEGAGSLFKKRPRREDVIKTWTLQGGLGTIAEAIAKVPGIQVRSGCAVQHVVRTAAGYQVATAGGEVLDAPLLAMAVPPAAASQLLQSAEPELAQALAAIQMASVDTLGAVVAKDGLPLPELAFVVPLQDTFFSAVTRDAVPDASHRGVSFHFRPGQTAEQQRARMCEVLGVPNEKLLATFARHTELPSPQVGHGERVAALDAAVAGRPMALCGNYFAGLAIEDCVARSKAEWLRLNPAG
ncbi:MAG: FAD-dependent oxidoreductase [Deltaproteobacteria bacterium]|nr:FAD-dependent oxidoreductase [Deltaproteobacteria bacterium]